MNTKILNTIESCRMLFPKASVVVGVSGGADSMALLHFLWEQKERWPGLRLTAAHVNHGLRGEEADRDERWVRDFCRHRGIPLEVLRIELREEAEKRKLGLEECGREVRYGFFQRLAGETGRIATAHTLSDSVETVLFNLARGTGLKGLRGIPAIRGNIIRPLIGCTREETEAYCRERQIGFVTDSTNLQEEYSRNKLRLSVIPVLKEINPAVEEAVGKMTESVGQDDDFLWTEAEKLVKEATLEDGWSCSVLGAAARPVRMRAVRLLRGDSGPEKRHLEEIDRIILAGSGGVSVPGGIDFHARKGVLKVVPHKKRRIPQ